jgi:hypothetical protein
MSNVIPIGAVTHVDLDPDEILENAKGEFTAVVVLGLDGEGNSCFLSSVADGGEVIWLLEKCKQYLLMEDMGGDE